MDVRPAVLCALALSAMAGCTEPIYRTTTTSVPPDDSYILVTPYFADVHTKLGVTLIQPPTPKADATGTIPPPPPVLLQIDVLPVPAARAFLFATKNAFFATSVDVGLTSSGLLSSSSSFSHQQVQAILTELAQTAQAVLMAAAAAAPGAIPANPANPSRAEDRRTCFASLLKEITSAPSYTIIDDVGTVSQSFKILEFNDDHKHLVLSLYIDIPTSAKPTKADVGGGHEGFVAFYPLPSTASLSCSVDGRDAVAVSTSVPLTIYGESGFFSPQRDFLTDPQETFTLSNGFITGHKYTDVSAAKTIVDTITSPIRALMPSVSVTTTQSQTQTPGKPTTTTESTSRVEGPPKATP